MTGASGGGGKRDRPDIQRSIGESYRTAHELLSASLWAGMLTYGGYWLDGRYGCLPLLTLGGGLLGSVSAIFAVRRIVQRMEQQAARERASRKNRA